MNIDYAKAVDCAISCQNIYRDWSPELFDKGSEPPVFIDIPKTDTQCVLVTLDSRVTIVFRGSDSSVDWNTNFDAMQARAEFGESEVGTAIIGDKDCEKVYPYEGKNSSQSAMHRGFTRAYFSARDLIHAHLRDRNLTGVTVTGHSLGGALATLCAVDVQYNFTDKVSEIEVYTFGSPRVGNDGFRASFNRRVPHSYRFVHGMDIVPALPRWWQGGYRHVDRAYRIGSRLRWNVLSGRFQDHAIGNYIQALKQYV